MRLSLLISFLYYKLKKSVKKYEPFRDYLSDKNFTLLVKTEDGRFIRTFSFKNGTVDFHRGDCEKTDVTMLWKNSKTAFDVMTDKDDEAVIQAMKDNKLRLLGESHYALVFGNIMQEMFDAPKR